MTATAIAQLESGPRTREAVDAFFASHSFPIVDGNSITFVWRGEAEAVILKHWVFGLPSSQKLARVDNTDVWHLTLQLPANSRVEYKLEVVRNGHGEWTQDRLNPNTARDPFGGNSVAHGTGYEIPTWIQPDSTAAKGHRDEIWIESKTFGRRGFGLYIPSRFQRSRQYPLLVVHDGHDYLRYAAMGNILDNLIDRLEIADAIVVFTSSPDRLREYADDERHAKFVTEELVPFVERLFPIDPQPQSRCLMGASFGAVASLYAKVQHPGVWGRLLLQSGSFAFTDIGDHQRGPVWDPIVRFVNGFRDSPRHLHARVYASCGTFESLIYYNRSLVPLFAKRTDDFRFTEAPDGHNWINWRDRLREGLTFLFPGPLWMYYE